MSATRHRSTVRRFADFGVTRHHRRSFAPVRLAIAGDAVLPLFAEPEPGSPAAHPL